MLTKTQIIELAYFATCITLAIAFWQWLANGAL